MLASLQCPPVMEELHLVAALHDSTNRKMPCRVLKLLVEFARILFVTVEIIMLICANYANPFSEVTRTVAKFFLSCYKVISACVGF